MELDEAVRKAIDKASFASMLKNAAPMSPAPYRLKIPGVSRIAVAFARKPSPFTIPPR